jgi:hypothetical protein
VALDTSRNMPEKNIRCCRGNTSGKSRIFLIALKDAYRNLTTVLSNIKSEVAKPDRAWDKSSLPMNLTYSRLTVRLILDLG